MALRSEHPSFEKNDRVEIDRSPILHLRRQKARDLIVLGLRSPVLIVDLGHCSERASGGRRRRLDLQILDKDAIYCTPGRGKANSERALKAENSAALL